jgi:hypothetical protein
MRGKLVALALALLTACVLASQVGAADVEHFTDGPFDDVVCGVEGTTVVHGTAVVNERSDGSATFAGTFWLVFTADNGKSITSFAAGPVMVTAPVIDEEAGTATIYATYRGLPEKVSVTHGRTLLRDAGTVTFVDAFEFTGDPDNPLGDEIDFFLQDLHGPILISSATSRRSAMWSGPTRKTRRPYSHVSRPPGRLARERHRRAV